MNLRCGFGWHDWAWSNIHIEDESIYTLLCCKRCKEKRLHVRFPSSGGFWPSLPYEVIISDEDFKIYRDWIDPEFVVVPKPRGE